MSRRHYLVARVLLLQSFWRLLSDLPWALDVGDTSQAEGMQGLTAFPRYNWRQSASTIYCNMAHVYARTDPKELWCSFIIHALAPEFPIFLGNSWSVLTLKTDWCPKLFMNGNTQVIMCCSWLLLKLLRLSYVVYFNSFCFCWVVFQDAYEWSQETWTESNLKKLGPNH